MSGSGRKEALLVLALPVALTLKRGALDTRNVLYDIVTASEAWAL